jgi:hypothetical protein
MLNKPINFRCPIDLYSRLKKAADEQDRTVSWIIIDALKKQMGDSDVSLKDAPPPPPPPPPRIIVEGNSRKTKKINEENHKQWEKDRQNYYSVYPIGGKDA